MPNVTPIRRYVLLRHRDHGTPAPRWSMERIAAAAPRDATRAPIAGRTKRAQRS